MPLNLLKKAIEEHKDFILYRLPHSTDVLLNIEEEGSERILITDFYAKNSIEFATKKPLVINIDSVQNLKIDAYKQEKSIQEINQKAYEEYVEIAIDFIKKKEAQKIVCSRVLEEEINLNELETFKNIITSYPTAFCYLFCSKKTGVWMGASPEMLFTLEDKKLTTMSLAGTRVLDDFKPWTPKEVEEQQLVTDYITNQLKSICSKIKKSEIYTAKAGHLAHLKTDIVAELNSNKFEYKTLHPTPAVCGLPQKKAIDFIARNESYNREFYAGFIGLQSEEKRITFVNIRCMQLLPNSVFLYVGGGIVKDSDPTDEWIETDEKLKTLKNKLIKK